VTFAEGIACRYTSGWYQPEHRRSRTWRWGPAVIHLHNPQSSALVVQLDFDMWAETARVVEVRTDGVAKCVSLDERRSLHTQLGPVHLAAGDTALEFDTSLRHGPTQDRLIAPSASPFRSYKWRSLAPNEPPQAWTASPVSQ
jgi:hypothetical protein